VSELKATEYKKFEDIKIIRADGSEYWPARELAPVLDYAKWENFSKVIDRAMLACRNSGFEIADHFPEVRKMVEMPSKPRKNKIEQIGFPEVKKTKNIIDYELSRYTEESMKAFITGAVDPFDDAVWEAHLRRYQRLGIERLINLVIVFWR